jgi:REP element-mobilizing transposase RayT
VIDKFSKRFQVKVYDKAICGNHIHCLVKGETREGLQNFFRVVAGHIAQEILRNYPLQPHERKAVGGAPKGLPKASPKVHRPHPKNVRKFWSLLLWSRVVSWGRDYAAVLAYILQNTKEALGLVAYKPRRGRFAKTKDGGDSLDGS